MTTPCIKKLWLTRHGESQYNTEGRIGGDSKLSSRGERYAKGLRRTILSRIRKGSSVHVWTSTLQRTRLTARHLPFNKTTIKALDEIDAGIVEGLTYEEFKDRFPAEDACRHADKLRYRYPEGESYLDIAARIAPLLQHLKDHGIQVPVSHLASEFVDSAANDKDLRSISSPTSPPWRLSLSAPPAASADDECALVIVAHQAVLRVLYGILMTASPDSIPRIEIPLHTLIELTPTATGALHEERIPVAVDGRDDASHSGDGCDIDCDGQHQFSLDGRTHINAQSRDHDGHNNHHDQHDSRSRSTAAASCSAVHGNSNGVPGSAAQPQQIPTSKASSLSSGVRVDVLLNAPGSSSAVIRDASASSLRGAAASPMPNNSCSSSAGGDRRAPESLGLPFFSSVALASSCAVQAPVTVPVSAPVAVDALPQRTNSRKRPVAQSLSLTSSSILSSSSSSSSSALSEASEAAAAEDTPKSLRVQRNDGGVCVRVVGVRRAKERWGQRLSRGLCALSGVL